MQGQYLSGSKQQKQSRLCSCVDSYGATQQSYTSDGASFTALQCVCTNCGTSTNGLHTHGAAADLQLGHAVRCSIFAQLP